MLTEPLPIDPSPRPLCNSEQYAAMSDAHRSKRSSLALEVLGSFLCGRSEAEWIDALDRLKRIQDNNIIEPNKATLEWHIDYEKVEIHQLERFYEFGGNSGLLRIPYLEYLCLSWCKSLVGVHHSLGKLKALAKVDLETSESLESLTSLRDLNLSLCKILNLDTLLNVTSLTNLSLSNCGLNDGSIPDDFGSLSSPVALDLSCNNFVNLPSGCISSLFRLRFLSLECCTRLKSLPRLPPRLIGLHATSCDSMEPPLSSMNNYGIWLLHLTMRPLDETKCAPLERFLCNYSRRGIPSWFSNNTLESLLEDCVIKVNIPPDFRDGEWLGIVVCLPLTCWSCDYTIYWSTKAPKMVILYTKSGALY
ncbi:hypothetical protein K1719_044324 [Acacia pycnantha]|nr:hypothetical protein K1719_044324 [Acacia pycnantha]